MRDWIIGLLRREPARIVTYGTALAVWLAVKISEVVGVPIVEGGEEALAIGTLATFVLTEIVRRLVTSPATAEALRAEVPPGYVPAPAVDIVEDGTP